MNNNTIDIRATILARMHERGWSQRRLAIASGLQQQTVNRYCAGQRDMTGDRLGQILAALELHIQPISTAHPRAHKKSATSEGRL